MNLCNLHSNKMWQLNKIATIFLACALFTSTLSAPAQEKKKCKCKGLVISPSEQTCLLGHMLEVLTHLIHNQKHPLCLKDHKPNCNIKKLIAAASDELEDKPISNSSCISSEEEEPRKTYESSEENDQSNSSSPNESEPSLDYSDDSAEDSQSDYDYSTGNSEEKQDNKPNSSEAKDDYNSYEEANSGTEEDYTSQTSSGEDVSKSNKDSSTESNQENSNTEIIESSEPSEEGDAVSKFSDEETPIPVAGNSVTELTTDNSLEYDSEAPVTGSDETNPKNEEDQSTDEDTITVIGGSKDEEEQSTEHSLENDSETIPTPGGNKEEESTETSTIPEDVSVPQDEESTMIIETPRENSAETSQESEPEGSGARNFDENTNTTDDGIPIINIIEAHHNFTTTSTEEPLINLPAGNQTQIKEDKECHCPNEPSSEDSELLFIPAIKLSKKACALSASQLVDYIKNLFKCTA